MPLYEILLALHITSVIGWGGLSTGAYLMLRSCGGGCFPAYKKVAYLEFISAVGVFLTGLLLALFIYGFPKSPIWIHVALGIAFAVGVLELFMLLTVAKGSYEKYVSRVRLATPLWVIAFVVMIWLMIFKPF